MLLQHKKLLFLHNKSLSHTCTHTYTHEEKLQSNTTSDKQTQHHTAATKFHHTMSTPAANNITATAEEEEKTEEVDDAEYREGEMHHLYIY